jgi:hypothetical protein
MGADRSYRHPIHVGHYTLNLLIQALLFIGVKGKQGEGEAKCVGCRLWQRGRSNYTPGGFGWTYLVSSEKEYERVT